jgi:hypothetical protein
MLPIPYQRSNIDNYNPNIRNAGKHTSSRLLHTGMPTHFSAACGIFWNRKNVTMPSLNHLTLFWENVAALVNPDVQKLDHLGGAGKSTNYVSGAGSYENSALLLRTKRI